MNSTNGSIHNTLPHDTSMSRRALEVKDRGVDTPENRPGVPKERLPPNLAASPRRTPMQQRATVRVLKRVELDQLTPVFGTAQPPKGLSGLVRAAAYAIPEHHSKHWMMLLLADRIDVLEHSLARSVKWLPLALPVMLLARSRSRRRNAWSRAFA